MCTVELCDVVSLFANNPANHPWRIHVTHTVNNWWSWNVCTPSFTRRLLIILLLNNTWTHFLCILFTWTLSVKHLILSLLALLYRYANTTWSSICALFLLSVLEFLYQCNERNEKHLEASGNEEQGEEEDDCRVSVGAVWITRRFAYLGITVEACSPQKTGQSAAAHVWQRFEGGLQRSDDAVVCNVQGTALVLPEGSTHTHTQSIYILLTFTPNFIQNLHS